jgi:hypothetical protein
MASVAATDTNNRLRLLMCLRLLPRGPVRMSRFTSPASTGPQLPQTTARSGSCSGWAVRLARDARSPVHIAVEKSSKALIP